MPYRLAFAPAVRRQTKPLPPQVKRWLREGIDGLALDPRGPGTEPLTGRFHGLRRLRLGNYRVVYRIDEADRSVNVVCIGNRRDVYDQLARMQL